jgi:hypothetical protein
VRLEAPWLGHCKTWERALEEGKPNPLEADMPDPLETETLLEASRIGNSESMTENAIEETTES